VAKTESEPITTLIPERVDRLRWSHFHTRMVIALGVAWILDGLEITVASDVADILERKNTLHMSARGADVRRGVIIKNRRVDSPLETAVLCSRRGLA